MNTTLHTVSALVSGALLNLGFVRLAEWFDPVSSATAAPDTSAMPAALPCAACWVPAVSTRVA